MIVKFVNCTVSCFEHNFFFNFLRLVLYCLLVIQLRNVQLSMLLDGRKRMLFLDCFAVCLFS